MTRYFIHSFKKSHRPILHYRLMQLIVRSGTSGPQTMIGVVPEERHVYQIVPSPFPG